MCEEHENAPEVGTHGRAAERPRPLIGVIYEELSSVGLGVVLLILVILVSIFGSLVDQIWASAHVYGAWWFAGLLALLCLNLALCTIRRARSLLRRGRLGVFVTHVAVLVILLGALMTSVSGEKGTVQLHEGDVVDSFRLRRDGQGSPGLNVQLYEDEQGFLLVQGDEVIGGFELASQKERALKFEVGTRGILLTQGGESVGSFQWRTGERRELGFQIRLADFVVERYPERTLRVWVNRGREPHSLPVVVGKEQEVEGTGCKVKVLRYVPDFVKDLESKKVLSRSEQPHNPAIEVQIASAEGTSSRWVLAMHPGLSMRPDPMHEHIALRFEMKVKDFKSMLEVLQEDKVVATKVIEVYSPLRFGGFAFYQHQYDPEHPDSTVLQVARDPGVPVVYAGFVLLVMGVFLALYGTSVSRLLSKRSEAG